MDCVFDYSDCGSKGYWIFICVVDEFFDHGGAIEEVFCFDGGGAGLGWRVVWLTGGALGWGCLF